MNENSIPMQLRTIQTISKSDVNEVRICENTSGGVRELYTVLVVFDHEVMHRFIDIYNHATYLQETPDIRMYTEEGKFFIAYPYVAQRPLMDFYMGNTLSLRECEEICVNIIISCMTGNLPWPILYLVLKQRQFHLSKDKSVYLGYSIDLTELSGEIGEGQCTVECAKLLIELLEQKAVRRANSYVLLKRKTEKQTYEYFRDLYKDLRVAMVPIRRGGILLKIKLWFMRNKDTIFRVLLRVSIVLAIFVILTFLTNLIFGDVPWLRLFARGFEQIGLESLLQ
ncbi:MAG: hypothetical protein K6G07_02410 [Lachnospiraceae bacterium]|nr:hypothetical protein [Lachnospiraceae bacterium]